MKERTFRILIEFIVTFLLCAGVFLLVLLLRGKFGVDGFCDACFVACTPCLLLPLFVIAIRSGTFDVLNYGMYRLFESFRPGEGKRYETAYDYKLARMERRNSKKPIFFPFFVVGGVFLAAALILYVIYRVSLGA